MKDASNPQNPLHPLMQLGLLGSLVFGSFSCLDAIDALDPNVGPPLGPRCANQDGDPDVEVSFQREILPIITRSVAGGCGCHQPTATSPIGLEQSGLNLSSYTALREGGNNSRANIVVPGQPCDSVLWQKVSEGPPFGARMPFNGPPFLDDEARRKIADWIAEGARDN